MKSKDKTKNELPRIYETMVVEDEYLDEATKKKCIITFNRFGFRCGYVELDKNININKINWDCCIKIDDVLLNNILALSARRTAPGVDFVTHGGVTFVGYKLGKLTVGFDCGHCTDKSDIESFKKYFGNKRYEASIASTLASTGAKYATVKDIDYVREQLSMLAKQVVEYEKLVEGFGIKDNKIKWKRHDNSIRRKQTKKRIKKYRR